MRTSIIRLYASNMEQAQKMLSDVPNERMAELPFEGAKHPAWTLGHLALGAGMVTDFIGGNPGGFGGVPEAWTETCMPGTECQPDRSLYPAKADLLLAYTSVHERLAAAFESASEEILATEFPIEDWRAFFPTIGDAAVYVMTHHEGYHLGQLTQWRRAAGFGPVPA